MGNRDAGDRTGADRSLGAALERAAHGTFPAPDGQAEIVRPWHAGVEAVVSFTGHAFVATRLDAARLNELGADGFGGACAPQVMLALAGEDGEIDVLDALLVATGTGRTTLAERHDLDAHPRVVHARHWRAGVHVHGDERGFVTVGTGVGGLPELSFEVPPLLRGKGFGRALLAEALGLVPDGEPVLAAVAPGNAASLRAVLAVGFAPIGSVQLVRPSRTRGRGHH